jgi:hypothetical protein
VGSGVVGDVEHVPAAYDVARCEVFEGPSRVRPDIGRIDLHEVAGRCHPVVAWLAHGVGPRIGALQTPGVVQAGLANAARLLEKSEDAAHARDGERKAPGVEQDGEFVFSPAWVLPPQAADQVHLDLGPGPLPEAVRPPAALLESARAALTIAFEPDVEGGAAEAEVARREADLTAVVCVPADDLQTMSSSRREPCFRSGLSGSGGQETRNRRCPGKD